MTDSVTIRFAFEYTLPRLIAGLLLYGAVMALVWPPNWGEGIAAGVGSALLVAALTGFEVER